MPGDNERILAVARSLRGHVKALVLGGIAVYLHGYPRATTDLDLYAEDRQVTASQLEAAGATWDSARREHVLDDVPIHTVTPQDAGHVVDKTSVIDGVRVVSLKDLIAIKLLCGLGNVRRSKDGRRRLAHLARPAGQAVRGQAPTEVAGPVRATGRRRARGRVRAA